jgi:CBS domain-containing protein
VRLSEILTQKPRRVVSLPASATAVEAAALMNAERVGAVVVRDERGRLAGLLSERDLALMIVSHGAKLFRTSIGEIMTIGGPTAVRSDSIQDLMRAMTERRTRHVPVIEGETVVGVVSIGDLLKARIAEKNQENAVLQDIARARLPG